MTQKTTYYYIIGDEKTNAKPGKKLDLNPSSVFVQLHRMHSMFSERDLCCFSPTDGMIDKVKETVCPYKLSEFVV